MIAAEPGKNLAWRPISLATLVRVQQHGWTWTSARPGGRALRTTRGSVFEFSARPLSLRKFCSAQRLQDGGEDF